jgi:mannose-6-phosphate isomerase-like protein (cupin superfamily)
VIALPGVTAVFKAVANRRPGDFVVLELTADPGFAGPRPHLHHRHEELFYVIDGQFDFFVDGEVRRVGPGSFVNVPPGVMHDFRNPGTEPARWLGIASPAGLDRYFEEVLALVAAGTFSEEELRRLRHILASRSFGSLAELDAAFAGWGAGPPRPDPPHPRRVSAQCSGSTTTDPRRVARW